MSSTSTAFTACPNIQDWLDNQYANCATRENVPLVSFLRSPENIQGVEQLLLPGNGKIRRVELKYMPRLPLTTVSSNQPIESCTSSNKRGDTSIVYDVDPNINEQIDFYVDIKDFIRSCEDKTAYFPMLLQNHIDALARKIWRKTAQQAVLSIGKWAGDVANVTGSTLTIRTLETSSTDKYTPQGWVKLKTAITKTGYCAPYVVFAGDTFYEYAQVTRMGCCNDNGIDVGQLFNTFGNAVIWDREVRTAFGSENDALVVQLGALQLLNFSLFEGDNQLDAPQYKRMSITDPNTGLKIDMHMKDDCGKLSVVLTAVTKLISLPNDLFPSGDTYDGVKWVNKLTVNNV